MPDFDVEFTKVFGFLLAQEFQKASPKDTGEFGGGEHSKVSSK